MGDEKISLCLSAFNSEVSESPFARTATDITRLRLLWTSWQVLPARCAVTKNEGGLLVSDLDAAVRLEINSHESRFLTEQRRFVVAKISAIPVACLVLKIISTRAARHGFRPHCVWTVDIVGHGDATAVATVASRLPVDAADKMRAAEIILSIALEERRPLRSHAAAQAKTSTPVQNAADYK